MNDWLKENLKTLLYALLIAGFIRSVFFEPFHIPSGSMKDGLLEGDFIIVSKYSYGYSKYSFPFALMPIKNRVFFREPERGDVVVFRQPTNTRINYIKRLIGKPGDEIQVIGGVLYINGVEVKRVADGSYIDVRSDTILSKYIETLDNGKKYSVLDELSDGVKDNTPKYIVPKEHYFFMGDNRDNSQDSRYLSEVGFVHKRNLVGKARFIFMSKDGSLLQFWNWHKNVRWERVFMKIE